LAGEYAVPPSKAFLTYDEKWVDPRGNKFLDQNDTLSFTPAMLRDAVEQYLSAFPDDLTGLYDGPLTPEQAIFGDGDRIRGLDLSKSSGQGGSKASYVD